ncbi:HNH endonuclease [Paenibacillus sp. 1011MAR3C5]|nr:HNH endonuclease [Paenibacillus sp. 1011MAR3C5]
MPSKPKRPCGKPGCKELATEKYCEAHVKSEALAYERARGSAYQRGYDSKWQRYSRRFLRANPLCACADCAKLLVPKPSEVTDHIIPHKGDKRLFWDPKNHQPMAKRCHDRKTAKEDGGFGR